MCRVCVCVCVCGGGGGGGGEWGEGGCGCYGLPSQSKNGGVIRIYGLYAQYNDERQG